MLSIATERLPRAAFVRAQVPSLPLPDRNTFDRAFAANFYGHHAPGTRVELLHELYRVAQEIVVLEQLAPAGKFCEGFENRQLADGSDFEIYNCYFTAGRLHEELGGGVVLMNGPMFTIVRPWAKSRSQARSRGMTPAS